MAAPTAIPESLVAAVVEKAAAGVAHREIAAWLGTVHGLKVSHRAVGRLLERVRPPQTPKPKLQLVVEPHEAGNSKRRQAGPGRPFPPGQSGNPNGRPKGHAESQRAARDFTTEALATLVACMDDEEGSVRVKAATAILDRGWGRPQVQRDEMDQRKLAAEVALLEQERDKIAGTNQPRKMEIVVRALGLVPALPPDGMNGKP